MVRNTLPSVAMLLSELEIKERNDILDDLLSIPVPKERQKKRKIRPGGGTSGNPSPPPIFDREHSNGKLKIYPRAGFSRLNLPETVTFEFAYQMWHLGIRITSMSILISILTYLMTKFIVSSIGIVKSWIEI